MNFNFSLKFRDIRSGVRVVMNQEVEGKTKLRVIEEPDLEKATKRAFDELLLRMTGKSPDIC